MADTRLPALTEITALDDADVLYVVDVSTTTDHSSGSSRYITWANLTELIEDIVGAMFSSNTETRVTVTYQDGDGTIDVVVDDMSGGMTSFQLEDGDGTEVAVSDAKEVKFVEGAGIDIDWTDTSTGSDADPYDLTFTCNQDVTTFTGRLTGQSANFISTTDQTLLGTIYLCGPTGSTFRTFLWDGSAEYNEFMPSQLSLSFSGATSLVPHDVFLYDSSGTATLTKTAWSSSTSRATALAIDAHGVIHKSGAATHRYVGTVYCYATGTFTDSKYSRHIWNLYNQRPRALHCPMTGSAWTYSSNTIRASNSNTTINNMRCDWVQGMSDHEVELVFRQMAGYSGTGWGWNGIGIDSTSTDSAQINSSAYFSSASTFGTIQSEYRGFPGIGYHYGQCLENSPGMVSIYFYGTDGSNNSGGMIGHMWC